MSQTTESKKPDVVKYFPCRVLEMAQHTTGKWKKHPHTTIRLTVKGLIEQKTFEEILGGLGNGYYCNIEIGYLKPKSKKQIPNEVKHD